jgi:hypothetical protein
MLAARVNFSDTDRQRNQLYSDAADKSYRWHLNTTQPWIDWDKEAIIQHKSEIDQDVNQWQREFGNIDDPENQRDIDALSDWLASGEPPPGQKLEED